jgi:hypothetical protein
MTATYVSICCSRYIKKYFASYTMDDAFADKAGRKQPQGRSAEQDRSRAIRGFCRVLPFQ